MAEKTTKRPRRATKRSAATKEQETAQDQATPVVEESAPASDKPKKTTRRATKKATAKKAPAKKAEAKKAEPGKKTRKRVVKKAPEKAAVQEQDQFAAVRAELPEKMRVHQLAKTIEMPNKAVITALAEMGVKKTASSNITRDEALALLDSLAPAPAEEPGFTEEEKLRHRVEKNVENEISQIEEKVDRELSGAKDEPQEDEEKLRHRIEKNVENEISQIEDKVDEEISQRLVSGLLADEEDDLDFSEEQDDPEEATEADFDVVINLEEAAELEKEADLLEDVEDKVTPAPEHTHFAMPIFMAPTISQDDQAKVDAAIADALDSFNSDDADDDDAPRKRRRGRRGTSRGRGSDEDRSKGRKQRKDESEDEVEQIDEPMAIKGSTRLEAQRRRRNEMREESRKKRHVVSEAEFLARRESVTRTMVVRERERGDHPGVVTQVGVLEDEMLVEHFVTSDTQASMVGNIYLGRVQNVLPSMEAAFIDIGKGRNGVLYAGEVNWRQAGLGGRNRKIEQALKSGDQVLVQVSKDPVGHKGARLTTQISLAGRYLVYVPGGRTAGISRKLPAPERKRLKEILRKVVPGDGGVIIRTAAEGVSEESIAADVGRLHTLWEQIQERTDKEMASKGAKPQTMYEEPNMLVKVIRDLFNEDFTELVVDGKRAWNTVHAYISSVAPELQERLTHFKREEHDGQDAFQAFRVDEQLHKALSRKVWLPSGGTLVIDRTEAMTVIDVNTGKFTGAGGNLEETVTRNNLEAAEEIVRQMRLRDLGGMIVVDFIDMVLPENQDLVLRRLKETLGRDRTRHQISEVTSLGLVQMTRKRLGTGLLETFATECEHCEGRGVIIHDDPVEHRAPAPAKEDHGVRHQDPTRHPAAVAMHNQASIEELAAAVVIDSDDTSDAPKADDDKAPKKSRRRGGSRRTKRDETPQDSVIDIVDAALERAGEEDPDEPSGADHMPEVETYEEAVAAFEASPRRKRKTRGNSASDVPPRQEDFEEKEEKKEEAEEPSRSRNRGRRRAVKKADPAPAPEAKEEEEKPTRGRRRAVKKADPAPAPEAKEEEEKPTRGRRRAVKKADPAPEIQESEDKPARGRRRAVRKSSSRSAEKPVTEETTVSEESSAPSTRRGGRGRRRAVRKES